MDVTSLLEKGPEPKWYTVPGCNGDQPARVFMKAIKPGIRDQMVRQHTRPQVTRGQVADRTDWRALNADYLEVAIEKWDHIEKDGQPFPCTRENKILLHDSWPAFNSLWISFLQQQGELVELLEEAETGN